MKVKKLFTGLLITSLTALLGMQLLVSATGNETIKTNTVYAATEPSPKVSAETDLNAFYNEKCFKVLEFYFDITQDQLPKDAQFTVFVMTKESLDKEEASWLDVCEQLYAQKQLTKQEYTKQKEELKNRYNDCRNEIIRANHDIIVCQLGADGDLAKSFYEIYFNANTKEITSVMCPYSEEGWNLHRAVSDGKKPSPASEVTDQIKTTNGINFITTHQIAGIKNPEVVKIAGSTHNHIYYQDASEPNKKVLLIIDPVTYNIVEFDCGYRANELD